MEYKPWIHAEELEVSVQHRHLPGELLGRYVHSERTILLKPNLSALAERCVLAHELVHAEYGDEDTRDRLRWQRQEWRADRIAARRLIHMDDYIRACSIRSHPRLVAMELNVAPWVVRAFTRDLEAQGVRIGGAGHGLDSACI